MSARSTPRAAGSSGRTPGRPEDGAVDDARRRGRSAMAIPSGARWMRLAAGSVAAAAVLPVSAWFLLAGPSLDRAERAYERGDWRSATDTASAWLHAHP